MERIGGGGRQRRGLSIRWEAERGAEASEGHGACLNAGGGASCVAMPAGGRGKRAWRLGRGEGQGSMRCALSRMTALVDLLEMRIGFAREKRGDEPASARQPYVARGWAVPPR